jgi:hypothetical protein
MAARFNLKQYRAPSEPPVLWNVDIKACIRYQGSFDFGLMGEVLFCAAAKADPQFAMFRSPGNIRGS